MESYKLYSAKESGANIIEYLLEDGSIKYEINELEWDELKKPAYRAVNPLAQVPSLVLPDGIVMTESLAIALYLNEKYQMNLAPMNDPKFLRWVVFLVGSYYPTFTFGDNPTTWVTDVEASKELREKTDEVRKKMVRQIEDAFSEGEYFLGEKISLIDIYLSFMFKWRPGEEWITNHCPKITRAVTLLRKNETYKKVAARNKI